MNLHFCNNNNLALLQQNICCQDFPHFTVPIWEKKQFQNHQNLKGTVVQSHYFQNKDNHKGFAWHWNWCRKDSDWKIFCLLIVSIFYNFFFLEESSSDSDIHKILIHFPTLFPFLLLISKDVTNIDSAEAFELSSFRAAGICIQSITYLASYLRSFPNHSLFTEAERAGWRGQKSAASDSPACPWWVGPSTGSSISCSWDSIRAGCAPCCHCPAQICAAHSLVAQTSRPNLSSVLRCVMQV